MSLSKATSSVVKVLSNAPSISDIKPVKPFDMMMFGMAKPEVEVDVVTNFLNLNFPEGLVYTNENFLGYKKGVWRRLEERAEVAHKIAKFFPPKLESVGFAGCLLQLIKNLQAKKEEDVAPNKTLICLNNGTLDTTSYQLLPHNPEHWMQTKISVDWNPESTCPRWLQFLDEIFVNDIDKVQKIAFVQEWFGYCLVPDSSQHKFVWMVGAGGNGKSVLLSVLTYLVGKENVSHAYMERLDRACVRAELEGKLVNISPEMSAEATVADGYLKAIVSGDTVEAERKYKPSYSFRPYVRLIGATNHLPRLLDLSDGFFRRAIILGFNRQFTGAECDPQLETKLLAELPGILVWALEGLRRFRARDKFEIPQSSLIALAQYKMDSDPVGLFVDECLERDNTYGIKSSQIYSGYQQWCKDNGFQAKNHVGFGKRLGELGFKSYRKNDGNYWMISLKENLYFMNAFYEIHPEPDWSSSKLSNSEGKKLGVGIDVGGGQKPCIGLDQSNGVKSSKLTTGAMSTEYLGGSLV